MVEFLPLLIVAAAIYIVWHLQKSKGRKGASRRGSRTSRSAQTPRSTVPPGPISHHWTNNGFRDVEIVGEASYQSHLRAIVQSPSDDGVEVDCTAVLVPEPSNPYDSNAVRVDIDGGTVGYLSKTDAVAFHKRLANEGLSGATTSCPAKVFGGKKNGRARTAYGVWLEMKRL